ncbi:MAG: hypothetical protein CME65_11550 [Halobacteriovoraceae bacterium]|nr:hypothetical protein [Halobacteriovoraceae bacterium]|tara:strand:- start:29691 stop:30452 length:762 start_codon:yes stop_codon:yes gene_type:complete
MNIKKLPSSRRGFPKKINSGAKHFPATKKWNCSYFLESMKSEKVRALPFSKIENRTPLFNQIHILKNQSQIEIESILLHRYGEYVIREEVQILKNNQTLLEDINYTRPYGSLENLDFFHSFFFAPPGYTVEPHTDDLSLYLFQIKGKKVVRVVAPEFNNSVYRLSPQTTLEISMKEGLTLDQALLLSKQSKNWSISEANFFNIDLSRFDKMKNVDIYETELNGGDILEIPQGWWHSTFTDEESFAFNVAKNKL